MVEKLGVRLGERVSLQIRDLDLANGFSESNITFLEGFVVEPLLHVANIDVAAGGCGSGNVGGVCE